MTFALENEPSLSDVANAINYMLSNFGSTVNSDPNTGVITGPSGQIIGYLYRYMAIKYADDYTGTVNFSNSPTGRSYYGLRNSNDFTESTNPSDYIWYQATGGFGSTKKLWYQTTGGRQIKFVVAPFAPDVGWLEDDGSSIDLDIITSGTVPVIVETFLAYFTPSVLQVPRSGSPLAPVFTDITPTLYATDKGVVVPFVSAQTDTAVDFVNNTWRIGNSATTGYGDISYTGITVGDPSDMGDYAKWPEPTAMPASSAYIAVPVRYKNSLGVVSQAGVAQLQLVYLDPGATGYSPPTVDISGYTGFSVNAGGAYTPPTATLSAITANVTAPTYFWSITGATPTSATTASVVVTPLSTSTSVTVSLTVNGTNLSVPISKTITMPVVYYGATGEAGANGVMSAFPSIYIWTGSSTPPTRPSTTSTYTWSTGAYTAPSGWYTVAPSNTTPGNYLWAITVPLNTSATTTTSTLDWTNASYPIRAIAYNGINGANASILALDSTAQTFTYNSAGAASPSSQTITFQANLQNLAGAATFVCTLYNSSGSSLGTVTLGGAGNTRTLTNTQFGAAAYAVISATLSGYTDQVTVVRLQDGANGTNGTNGQNAVTGFLTNESVTVQADSSGIVSSFATAGGSFKVYDGLTDVSASSTFSVLSSSGVTISITSGGVYSVSAMSASQASATLRAVYGTVTIDKVYTIAKSIAGATGSTGAAGAATFVVIRAANDSSAPTNAEVFGVIGRTPVAGDICTVNYNSGNNSAVYQYTTSWVLFTTYITGSLIVDGTITGSKIAANTITASNIAASTITSSQIAANTITASNMVTGTITAASGIIADAAITTAKIATAAITSAKIGDAQVNTLQIAGSAVTFPSAATSTASGANVTISLTSGDRVFITGYSGGSTSPVSAYRRNTVLSVSGAASGTLNSASQVSASDGAFSVYFCGMSLGATYTAPSTGSYTFTCSYDGVQGSSYGGTGIQVIGLKR